MSSDSQQFGKNKLFKGRGLFSPGSQPENENNQQIEQTETQAAAWSPPSTTWTPPGSPAFQMPVNNNEPDPVQESPVKSNAFSVPKLLRPTAMTWQFDDADASPAQQPPTPPSSFPQSSFSSPPAPTFSWEQTPQNPPTQAPTFSWEQTQQNPPAQSPTFSWEQTQQNPPTQTPAFNWEQKPAAPPMWSSVSQPGVQGNYPQAEIPPVAPQFNANTTRVLGQTENMQMALRPSTGYLGNPEAGNTGNLHLTGPIKVVKVPIAGQPGRYMTGILPVLARPQEETTPRPRPEFIRKAQTKAQDVYKKYTKIVILSGVAFLLIFVVLAVFITRPTSQPTADATLTQQESQATADAAVATSTAQVSTILNDPLSENIHNWPTSDCQNQSCVFKDGAYHLTNNDDENFAYALLPNLKVDAMVYKITTEKIQGDDNNKDNWYGVIFRFNSENKDGRFQATFYMFEVNLKVGKYEFRKYDNRTPNTDPFTQLKSMNVGDEFKRGDHEKNTFKVIAVKDKFTFFVNDKQVGDETENSFGDGGVGLLINQKGTEIAFSNLAISRP